MIFLTLGSVPSLSPVVLYCHIWLKFLCELDGNLGLQPQTRGGTNRWMLFKTAVWLCQKSSLVIGSMFRLDRKGRAERPLMFLFITALNSLLNWFWPCNCNAWLPLTMLEPCLTHMFLTLQHEGCSWDSDIVACWLELDAFFTLPICKIEDWLCSSMAVFQSQVLALYCSSPHWVLSQRYSAAKTSHHFVDAGNISVEPVRVAPASNSFCGSGWSVSEEIQ